MKKDVLRGRTVSILAISIIWVVAAVTGTMYFLTKYYLYFFFAVTSLFLGATNVLFMLLRYIDELSKAPKTEGKKKKKVKKAKRKKSKHEKESENAEASEAAPEELVEEISEEKPQKKNRISYYIVAKVLSYILYIVVFYFCNTTIWSYMKTMKTAGKADALNGILSLILFVILIVFDRVCKYAENETPFTEAVNENSRIFYKLLCFQTLLGVAYVIYESLNLYNIQKYVAYVYAVSFYYFVVFITLSLVVIAIRKEFCIAPYLNVPLPMWKTKGSQKRVGFIEYLETNTGISMRSLWSVKYIRQIAPMVVFLSGIFLWLSTCIVQVNTYQQAAVYRIGVLQEKILGPGIHLALPYPFDKVEIYDTEVVNKLTIGYRSEESTDNIWTEGHGEEEHKLLLGGGDELVSINLRLEYKISDLKDYLKTTSSPVSHMEAMAYELVTDQTIATDLDTLLSADRDAFAHNFKDQLSGMLEERRLGVEVVSVVLESIHPPVEIASVYQELISAEISAQKFLLYAQGNAAAAVANAEQTANTTIGTAQVENFQKLAEAKASATQFLASVAAKEEHKDAYTYYKRIKAVREAYGNANLVILGNGVDDSMLYFGNISAGTTEE